jgi:DNA repair protein RecO (recombination protein O)
VPPFPPSSTAPTVRDEAILLRRFPYSESSLVVRVFTPQHGKIGLMARGAHRPKSRYYCVLDHFDTLDLEWRPNRDRELMELRRGDLLVRRATITRDLETYRAASVACELVDLACATGQREPGTWALLSRCLDELAHASRPPWEATVSFELGFLTEHGLAPALETCAMCSGPAPAPDPHEARACFSASCGGRICESCADGARAAGRRVGTMPLDVLAAATLLLRGARQAERIDPLEPDLLLRLRDFVERFLDHHLEVRTKARGEFLSSADRNARSTLRTSSSSP